MESRHVTSRQEEEQPNLLPPDQMKVVPPAGRIHSLNAENGREGGNTGEEMPFPPQTYLTQPQLNYSIYSHCQYGEM